MIVRDVDKSKEQLVQELSECRHREKMLRVSEGLYRDLMACASDGLLILDGARCILSCNQAVLDIFSLDGLDDIRGRSLEALFPSAATYDDFQEILTPFMEDTGLFSVEWTLSRRDESAFLAGITMRLSVGTEDAPTRYVVGIRDLTLQQEHESQAAFAATHDVLTGLPNRLILQDRIDLAMHQSRRRQQPFTLMMIDLDHFNRVNASLGHVAGDALLKAAARRIGGILRREDTMARLGSDEFALLLFAAGQKGEAIAVARKVLTTFHEPFEAEGQRVSMTMSAGITIFPDDSQSAEELLRHAGMALQYAKELGRNGFECYSPDLEYQMVGA